MKLNDPSLRKRFLLDRSFYCVCLTCTLLGIVAFFLILGRIAEDALPRVSLDFLVRGLSHRPEEAGILPALVGSAFVVSLAMLFAAPLGIGAGIYLEEFAVNTKRAGFLFKIAAANLAGVPSIIYGLVGLAVFVRWFALGQSVLAGALTMAMVILPMIVVVTREALRSVPWSYREAAMGVGSTRWQAVKSQVLPVAKGGIFTGLFLSVGRAMGETAPLIMVGAAYYVSRFPKGVMDQYTVLPMQIFSWASDARREFHSDAAAATLVLMAVLLAVNGLVLWVRNRKSQAQSDSLL